MRTVAFLMTMSSLSALAELVDRVAAMVNQEVITWSEVRWAAHLAPDTDGKPEEAERRALENLIEQHLIAQQMVEMPEVAEVEITVVYDRIREKFASDEAFRRSLFEAGLDEDELRKMIRRQVGTYKFVDSRFRPFIILLPEEVEDYYRLKYVPELRRRRIETIPPLDEVHDKIQALLTEEKLDQEIRRWLEDLKKRAEIRRFL